MTFALFTTCQRIVVGKRTDPYYERRLKWLVSVVLWDLGGMQTDQGGCSFLFLKGRGFLHTMKAVPVWTVPPLPCKCHGKCYVAVYLTALRPDHSALANPLLSPRPFCRLYNHNPERVLTAAWWFGCTLQ